MKRAIKIFHSFEEQEQYNLEMMAKSTPAERFRKLYEMQQMTKALHPATEKDEKKITIRHGFTKS